MFVVPIRKDAHGRHFSGVIYLLILINVAVYVSIAVFSSPLDAAQRFGFIPAAHDAITVFTSMFLHASTAHLLGNMFFLWLFGEAVEGAIGHTLTALTYIVCGIDATVFYDLTDPHSSIPAVGASGAISGVVGLYMVLFPKAKVDLELHVGWLSLATIPTNSVAAILAWLTEQTLLGLAGLASGIGLGVAFFAHVGGLLAGIGLGVILVRSGFPARHGQTLARQAARSTICPSCRRRWPRLPAGLNTCPACRAKFRILEDGTTELVEPTKPDPSNEIVAPILVFAFILGAIGWSAWQLHKFFRH